MDFGNCMHYGVRIWILSCKNRPGYYNWTDTINFVCLTKYSVYKFKFTIYTNRQENIMKIVIKLK